MRVCEGTGLVSRPGRRCAHDADSVSTGKRGRMAAATTALAGERTAWRLVAAPGEVAPQRHLAARFPRGYDAPALSPSRPQLGDFARARGLELSDWIRCSCEETLALEQADELRVDAARRRQRAEQAGVREATPPPQPRPPSRDRITNVFVGTIGDALRQADAHRRC
jgi:hypothetical protein